MVKAKLQIKQDSCRTAFIKEQTDFKKVKKKKKFNHSQKEGQAIYKHNIQGKDKLTKSRETNQI